METINGRPGQRMSVRRSLKSVGADFGLRPIGYSPALSVTHSAAAAAVAACGAI